MKRLRRFFSCLRTAHSEASKEEPQLEPAVRQEKGRERVTVSISQDPEDLYSNTKSVNSVEKLNLDLDQYSRDFSHDVTPYSSHSETPNTAINKEDITFSFNLDEYAHATTNGVTPYSSLPATPNPVINIEDFSSSFNLDEYTYHSTSSVTPYSSPPETPTILLSIWK